MKSIPPTIAAIGLTTTCMATAAFANGFNSFVIEVPYEISVPEVYVEAFVSCIFTDWVRSPTAPFAPGTQVIKLQNGRAKGTLKFGADSASPAGLEGADGDILSMGDWRGQAQILVLAARPDFQLGVKCRVASLGLSPNNEINITTKDQVSYIDHGRAPVYLQGENSSHEFEVTITHSDNIAGQSDTGPNLTTQIPTQTGGLQNLKSLLDGK